MPTIYYHDITEQHDYTADQIARLRTAGLIRHCDYPTLHGDYDAWITTERRRPTPGEIGAFLGTEPLEVTNPPASDLPEDDLPDSPELSDGTTSLLMTDDQARRVLDARMAFRCRSTVCPFDLHALEGRTVNEIAHWLEPNLIHGDVEPEPRIYLDPMNPAVPLVHGPIRGSTVVIPVLFSMEDRGDGELAAAKRLVDILANEPLVGYRGIESWCTPNHPSADGSDEPVRIEIVPIGAPAPR